MKLWNKNFVLAFVGAIISAAGSVGLNVALSVVVFQETQSTTLSSVFLALSMIPQLVLPLIIGSFIDRRNPLGVLVKNEVLLAGIFFLTAAITHFWGFSYGLYLTFSLLISCFGVVSQLASGSITPHIMPRDQYVRGNAVLNVIYPLCSVVVTPIAMWLFERFGMPVILVGYGVASLIDAALESRIRCDFGQMQAPSGGLRAYAKDLKGAFSYFTQDRAVRSVFLLFALVMLSYTSESVLLYPFFNQSEHLTNGQYAQLMSIMSAGYFIGGLLHYFVRIPSGRRYSTAITVYFIFVVLDSLLFFMPFPVMCASKFLLGILGTNSASIRMSSIQAHVPNEQRAKLNALYSVLISATTIVGQLAVGTLGEVLPYRVIQFAFQGFYLAGILIFALPRKNGVKALYNYKV